MEAVRKFAAKFKEDLETLHAVKYKDDIETRKKKKLQVICNPVPTKSKNTSPNEEAASSTKSNGEPGFEESVESERRAEIMRGLTDCVV
jgi:hypothetical protein